MVPSSLGLVVLLEPQPQLPGVAVIALLAHWLQVNLMNRIINLVILWVDLSSKLKTPSRLTTGIPDP